ncbi:hypothetical protein VZT92_024014 [Zoarces viviparus]|uniref:Uncharacterized protein n=1 Tax=Zoarces viviparus TaxID=48416 RepID=A0AAW1E0Q8_ZOAVI
MKKSLPAQRQAGPLPVHGEPWTLPGLPSKPFPMTPASRPALHRLDLVSLAQPIPPHPSAPAAPRPLFLLPKADGGVRGTEGPLRDFVVGG